MNDFDSPFNTLSYDERVLSEKLGFEYDSDMKEMMKKNNQQPKTHDIEERIRRQLAPPIPKPKKVVDDDSDDETDRIIKKLRKRNMLVTSDKNDQPYREHFVGSRNGFCGGDDGMPSLLDNKMFIFLIIIVAVFCFMQYLNNQQVAQNMKEMMAMMQMARGAPVANMAAST
jgi:hypothetical protein